jgi:hypothetical protein
MVTGWLLDIIQLFLHAVHKLSVDNVCTGDVVRSMDFVDYAQINVLSQLTAPSIHAP